MVQPAVTDRSEEKTPAAVNVDTRTDDAGDEPAKEDPPSFPPQRWETKDARRIAADLWEVQDERDYLQLEEWEGNSSASSPEHILEALQGIYHQIGASVDGAASSLNAILQGPYFDDDSLMQLTRGEAMDVYSINMALRSFNLSLLPASSDRPVSEPHLENAFLVYQFKRWFPLRRIGTHWLNLSERIIRPVQILSYNLSLCLRQLQEDGSQIFVVLGKLPKCDVDDITVFDEHFRWYLNGGIIPEDVDSECCEGVCNGECTCYEYGEQSFEDELQAAIEASLADVQPKALVIKSSPPTSLISSEEQVGSSSSLKGVTSSQERDDDES